MKWTILVLAASLAACTVEAPASTETVTESATTVVEPSEVEDPEVAAVEELKSRIYVGQQCAALDEALPVLGWRTIAKVTKQATAGDGSQGGAFIAVARKYGMTVEQLLQAFYLQACKG